MNTWIDGRKGARIDVRDRGLQYGDGLFETMRVRGGEVRFMDYHLERLAEGCSRLKIAGPSSAALRRELGRIAALRSEGVLKLILTRGRGRRGYRPTGQERCTRIVALHPPP
ncbi:MAG: aminotransferase class IV, partial [Steroidobacteraceae bacterium]